MKTMFVFFGLAIIVVVGILLQDFSFTTGTVSIDTSQQSVYMAKFKRSVKKKSCACCDKKPNRINRMMHQWFSEKPKENVSDKEYSAIVAEPD